MIEHVKMTLQGDVLKVYSESESKDPDCYLVGPMSVFIHDLCCGWVDCIEVSNTHNVLRCRKCAMRIYIPKMVTNWTQLKAHFDEVETLHKD